MPCRGRQGVRRFFVPEAFVPLGGLLGSPGDLGIDRRIGMKRKELEPTWTGKMRKRWLGDGVNAAAWDFLEFFFLVLGVAEVVMIGTLADVAVTWRTTWKLDVGYRGRGSETGSRLQDSRLLVMWDFEVT
ncbi:hypothetical protein FPQ18DRAFT_301764 [Pyronema domesticum]|nr:hypothetical protein FPQ18DRAFT_301764 [Pyronema domesticum]